MRFASMRLVAAVVGAACLFPALGQAQSVDSKATAAAKSKADAESQKKIDEFADAAKRLGGPAANPECVWLGRRVVSLLWRDDLDTAFRHLDLYDRFGCPAGHIQATFRCLVRQGNIDPKQPETLNGRVHSCWINPEGDAPAASAPAAPAAPAAAAAPAAPPPAAPAGTANR